MKKKLLLILALGLCLRVYAQSNPVEKAADSNIVKTLFFAGLQEKMHENYLNASTSFNKILELDPKNDAALFELATLSMRQRKWAEAEIHIKRALAINAQNTWYHRLQAEIYKQTGNMEALTQVFDKLIALLPDNEDLYFDRANAIYLSGKKDEALKAYEAIAAKFGTSADLTAAVQRINMQNQGIPAAGAIDKMLADDPADIKNYLYMSGLLLEKKKPDEAFTLLQKAKTVDPDNFEVDLGLADVYRAKRLDDKAAASLKSAFAHASMPVEHKIRIISGMLGGFNNAHTAATATDLSLMALQIHPDEPRLLILYGDVLYQQQQLNAAKDQYKATIKLSEQFYPAWEKLLALQTLTGQYAEAIKTGEEALSLYPNQAILYYYRAFALHRNGQNAEAGIEIKSALQLDGDDAALKAMIFALQAEVLIDQQKLKEADAAFDKSIALDPDNYLTLSNYAYYLALRNHNLGKAETLAAKAANALSQNASAADTYAFVLFKLEKYSQAKNWIERALQQNEQSNPVFLEHYGDILFLYGDKDGALIQWQKAKQSGGNSDKLIKKINEKKYIR